jgi:uncharacterized membrane protein YwaF
MGTSLNHFIYLFIDDFLGSTYLYLSKSKDEVFNYFQEFNNRIENQYNGMAFYK